MPRIRKIAKDSGYAEGLAGVPLSSNPYVRDADPTAWRWWRDGWARGVEEATR